MALERKVCRKRFNDGIASHLIFGFDEVQAEGMRTEGQKYGGGVQENTDVHPAGTSERINKKFAHLEARCFIVL